MLDDMLEPTSGVKARPNVGISGPINGQPMCG